MRKLSIAAIALLALTLLGYAAQSPTTATHPAPPKRSTNTARGEIFFESTCALCHGPDGRGKPQLGKDLVNQSDWMTQQTDATLVAFIKEGRANGPDYKVPMLPRGGDPNLTDRDLAEIVAYLRALQQQDQ